VGGLAGEGGGGVGQDEHRYRFLHVSTDEVYGERGVADAPEPGHETRSALNPTNPYAATKVNPGRCWGMALGVGEWRWKWRWEMALGRGALGRGALVVMSCVQGAAHGW
jgi:hypothetical protein